MNLRIRARRDNGIAAGTSRAIKSLMATVFALIFLPALAAIGLMALTTTGDAGLASYVAFACFFLLTSGMFVGAYKMMKKWEDEPV